MSAKKEAATRWQSSYPLRFDPGVREAAQKQADQADRSLNWMVNKLLKQVLGLKQPSQTPVAPAHTR